MSYNASYYARMLKLTYEFEETRSYAFVQIAILLESNFNKHFLIILYTMADRKLRSLSISGFLVIADIFKDF